MSLCSVINVKVWFRSNITDLLIWGLQSTACQSSAGTLGGTCNEAYERCQVVGSRRIPAAGSDTWQPREPGLRITGFLKGKKKGDRFKVNWTLVVKLWFKLFSFKWMSLSDQKTSLKMSTNFKINHARFSLRIIYYYQDIILNVWISGFRNSTQNVI